MKELIKNFDSELLITLLHSLTSLESVKFCKFCLIYHSLDLEV